MCSCAPVSPPATELRFLGRFSSGKEVEDLNRTDRKRGNVGPEGLLYDQLGNSNDY